jgi:hypothetical protein
MSQQENGCSRREMSGMTVSLMLRRRVMVGIAAILMGASRMSIDAINVRRC